MPRTLATCTATALSAVILCAGAPLAAQREMRERRVVVSVTDRAGAPSLSLSPREFIVREDGIAREILSVAPAPPPSHIVLLVDDSQAIEDVVMDVRAAAGGFIRAVTGGAAPSAVSIMTFGARPTRQTDFTTAAPVLDQAIARVFQQAGAGAYFLDAVVDATRALQERQAEQPVIVAFIAEAGPEFSERRATHVADALRTARASLWTVVLQSSAASNSQENQERAKVVTDVARASGGHDKLVLSREGLRSGFGDVAALIKARYEVRYGRPDSLVPPTTLDVTMRNAALRASAPDWVAP